jgi:hypothetical protein
MIINGKGAKKVRKGTVKVQKGTKKGTYKKRPKKIKKTKTL